MWAFEKTLTGVLMGGSVYQGYCNYREIDETAGILVGTPLADRVTIAGDSTPAKN